MAVHVTWPQPLLVSCTNFLVYHPALGMQWNRKRKKIRVIEVEKEMTIWTAEYAEFEKIRIRIRLASEVVRTRDTDILVFEYMLLYIKSYMMYEYLGPNLAKPCKIGVRLKDKKDIFNHYFFLELNPNGKKEV